MTDTAPPQSNASPRPRRIAVPGGSAELAAEVAVQATARPGEELVVQRLEVEGQPLVRLGYRRSGRMLRGPVTVTRDELLALLGAARGEPAIASIASPRVES